MSAHRAGRSRRDFIKRGALFMPAIFVPRLIRAQSVLTADGLAAFGNAPATGGGGSNLTFNISGHGTNVRHDFSGIVGCGFTATANVTVKALCRFVLTGNSAVHRVYLEDVSGNVIVFADVATSGVTVGTFAKTTIADTHLTSGNQYFILQTEVNNGDDWYGDNAAVTIAGDFTLAGSRYATAPNVGPNANANGSFAFGPASFEYTKP